MLQADGTAVAITGRGAGEGAGADTPGRTVVMRLANLLRVSLFHKILLASTVLVLLVAIGSITIAVEILHTGSWRTALGLFFMVAVAGAVAALPVYSLILRVALTPLAVLEKTAERVEAGDLGARAEDSNLADPRLARLVAVFNRLLDSLAADRRRLREVAARAFRAQEAERTRIARELQEETVQTLSALLIRLRVARQARDGTAKDEMLDELRRGMVDVTDRLRGVARDLHSPTLADLGVGAAVEAYARGIAETTQLRVSVHAQDVRGCLTPEGELAIYRVVQEALSNVVRHADAREVRIELYRGADAVEVMVEDDGRGFDLSTTERARPCLGLFGMEERALYAGGTVAVGSEPGIGTRVRIRVPVTGNSAREGLAGRPEGDSGGPCDGDHSGGPCGGGDYGGGRPRSWGATVGNLGQGG